MFQKYVCCGYSMSKKIKLAFTINEYSRLLDKIAQSLRSLIDALGKGGICGKTDLEKEHPA